VCFLFGSSFGSATVDARSHEALRRQLFEDLGVLALAVAHQRRQQGGGRPVRQLQHLVDHLTHGLSGQIDEMVRTSRNTGTRIEQAKVVVDFGNGADRGARIVGGGLLLDGDCRREALDGVDVGLVHH
jgi:hypothetical protein